MSGTNEVDKQDVHSSNKITNARVMDFVRKNVRVTLIIVILIVITVCYFLYSGAMNVGANALKDKFDTEYTAKKDDVAALVTDAFWESAEEKYHVKNTVAIEIGTIREMLLLEVLKVSDVEYIVQEEDSNNILSWLEVPGEATFVVDLEAGEYIIDEERAHVTIRLPYPELSNVKINYGGVKKLLFKDDIFDGSYSVGEALARQQLSEAELLIKREFMSNQNYYLNAQKAASAMIENLVCQLNPEVVDLEVTVEFY